MPHSFGYRARTRHMFKRGFKGVLLYQYIEDFIDDPGF
jgi:hypothetical protein